MSSTSLTTGDMKLIEQLLDAIYDAWSQRGIDVGEARAELFTRAYGSGPRIDTNFSRHLESHTGGVSRGDASYDRQEHMLPSPDEEFNAAVEVLPISRARHTDQLIIGRNFRGETALIRWITDGPPPRPNGHWARCDDNERFLATHWIPSTWVDEERKHSGRGAYNDVDSALLSRPLRSAIAAFLRLCQVEAGAVSAATAAGAIRRMFPEWEAAWVDLTTAIAEEAVRRGFPIDDGVRSLISNSLENWENEGGAVARAHDRSRR